LVCESHKGEEVGHEAALQLYIYSSLDAISTVGDLRFRESYAVRGG
jgi:hypothetical protein